MFMTGKKAELMCHTTKIEEKYNDNKARGKILCMKIQKKQYMAC